MVHAGGAAFDPFSVRLNTLPSARKRFVPSVFASRTRTHSRATLRDAAQFPARLANAADSWELHIGWIGLYLTGCLDADGHVQAFV